MHRLAVPGSARNFTITMRSRTTYMRYPKKNNHTQLLERLASTICSRACEKLGRHSTQELTSENLPKDGATERCQIKSIFIIDDHCRCFSLNTEKGGVRVSKKSPSFRVSSKLIKLSMPQTANVADCLVFGRNCIHGIIENNYVDIKTAATKGDTTSTEL